MNPLNNLMSIYSITAKAVLTSDVEDNKYYPFFVIAGSSREAISKVVKLYKSIYSDDAVKGIDIESLTRNVHAGNGVVVV